MVTASVAETDWPDRDHDPLPTSIEKNSVLDPSASTSADPGSTFASRDHVFDVYPQLPCGAPAIPVFWLMHFWRVSFGSGQLQRCL